MFLCLHIICIQLAAEQGCHAGEDCSVDFLSVAVKELVKARLVLCACAVMAYFTAQLPHQSHPGTYATTTHLGTRLDRVPRPSVMEMNRHYNTTLLDCLQVS